MSFRGWRQSVATQFRRRSFFAVYGKSLSKRFAFLRVRACRIYIIRCNRALFRRARAYVSPSAHPECRKNLSNLCLIP